jgi:hypothetical protein
MADQTTLAALMEFLEDDGFDTPPLPSPNHPDKDAEGKVVYHVPSPDGETGLKLQALADLAAKQAAARKQRENGEEVTALITEQDVKRLQMDDGEERDFLAMVLGTAYREMLEGGVSFQRIKRLGQYAFAVFTVGEQAANEAAMAGAFSGKAQAPANRQERRAGRGQTTGRASTGTRKRS